VRVLSTGYPFAYLRGGTLAVLLNPGRAPVSAALPGAGGAAVVLARGCRAEGDVVHLDGHGYAVLDLAR
jgi:maltose alpha-D-glucosyltransferase/alpha-amylase